MEVNRKCCLPFHAHVTSVPANLCLGQYAFEKVENQ